MAASGKLDVCAAAAHGQTMEILLAILMTAVLVMATTVFHYEGISRLDRAVRRQAKARRTILMTVIAALILIHVLEIGLYAAVYALAVGPMDMGGFVGERAMSRMDFFYYAAETYSSLGYGDIYPQGAVRVIASISPLNGVLLLAWSAAFLFSLVEDWRVRQD